MAQLGYGVGGRGGCPRLRWREKSQKRNQYRVMNQEPETYRRQRAQDTCQTEATQRGEDAAERTPFVAMHCAADRSR